MKLSTLVNPSYVKCPLSSKTKEEALAELARHVALTAGLSETEILEPLQARERQGPFSMSKGVAYPHARTDKLADFVIAIGTCPEGLDFGAPDGYAIRMVVMFLVPKKHSNLYLHTLALFLNTFSNEQRAIEVSRIASPRELVTHLEKYETDGQRQRHPLEDVLKPIPVLRLTDTLARATETILSNKLDRIPVVAEGDQLLGEVTLNALLKFAGPESKQRTLESVKGDVVREALAVQESATLHDVAAKLSQENVSVVYVLRNRKLLGAVNPEELLRKLIQK